MLSEETDSLKATLDSLGIHLKPILYKMDVRPLLKVVLDHFFGAPVGLVDMITEHIPSPTEAAAAKARCRLFISVYFRLYLPSYPGTTVIYWSDVQRNRAGYGEMRS